ncbi:holo-(acyl-carrier-protein) synthase, partial [Mycoplasma putrefaciens]
MKRGEIMKVGIDIVENKRIKLKESLIFKILSESELAIFNSKNRQEKREFLSGRW